MNVKADSLKSRDELLRENEQLRAALHEQVQSAIHNRATHHEYERMLEEKVAELKDYYQTLLDDAVLMRKKNAELEAQVAALSAPVTAGEFDAAISLADRHVSPRYHIGGKLHAYEVARNVLAARVSKLKENS